MSFLDDEKVKVKIDSVRGHGKRYDAWSVDARAWILEDGDRKFERTIALNVIKDRGAFDGEVPEIVEKVRESYETVLQEDPKFEKYFKDSLENERSKVDELEGSEFDL